MPKGGAGGQGANGDGSGLTMNMGFPAAMTSRACSRRGRPSFVSRNTTSTISHSSAIVSTTFTPSASTSSV